MVTPLARHSEQLQSLKLPVSPCQPLPAWYGVCVCISGNSLLQRERRLDRSKNFVKSQAAEVVHRLHCTVVDRVKMSLKKKCGFICYNFEENLISSLKGENGSLTAQLPVILRIRANIVIE